jgi:hypothetical protein
MCGRGRCWRTDPASSGTGRPLRGPPSPHLGGLAQRQHLLLWVTVEWGGLGYAVCSGEHGRDVIADSQTGFVRALAHQVTDDATGAGDDVVAIALVGAAPMSSSSHGFTQADDQFQEQARRAEEESSSETAYRLCEPVSRLPDCPVRTRGRSTRGRSSTRAIPRHRRRASASRAGPAGSPGPDTRPGRIPSRHR